MKLVQCIVNEYHSNFQYVFHRSSNVFSTCERISMISIRFNFFFSYAMKLTLALSWLEKVKKTWTTAKERKRSFDPFNANEIVYLQSLQKEEAMTCIFPVLLKKSFKIHTSDPNTSWLWEMNSLHRISYVNWTYCMPQIQSWPRVNCSVPWF